MKKLWAFVPIFFISWTAFAGEIYTLEADRVTRIDNSTFNATGNVILKVRDIVFNADNLTYYQDREEVEAKGNVRIKSPTQEIEAEEMTYNIRGESGKAYNIKGFLAPFHYICAKSMERTGATTFTVQDARISTCSGSIPDWSISMYSGKLELGGYINADHATANILNTPVVYVPKLLYPVSTERKSGFLLPDFGYMTDRGAFLTVKYFWAPLIDFDMTFGIGLFSKSGVQEQGEIRYALTSESSFYGAFERIDDAVSEADTRIRWRAILRNKYLPLKDLELNVNADHVSDYLYMRDFDRFGISEFNKTNKENIFFDEARVKYYNPYADISLLYRNDFEFRDTATGYRKTSVEQTPSFNISKVVTDIPFIALDYDLAFDRVQSKDYYYRSTPEGRTPTDPPFTGYEGNWLYNRFNAGLKVYAPIDLKVLTFTPSVAIGYTRWENSSRKFDFKSYRSPVFGEVHRINSRSADRYAGAVDASFAFREIYRDFGFLRHGIQNTVRFQYSPELKQDGLPDLIKGDRTDYYGSVSYEMKNFLNGKDWYLTLTLSQGYDMLQTSPILPLEAKLTASLFKIFTNVFEMKYKHSGKLEGNERRMQYLSDNMRVNITKYLYLTADYTFDSRVSGGYNTSAGIGGGINIWRFSVAGFYKWQANNKDISFNGLAPRELGGAVTYFAECWSLGLELDINSYNVNMQGGQAKRKETTVYVNFSLRGLGESRVQFMKLQDDDVIR